jgi:hypothetical protein
MPINLTNDARGRMLLLRYRLVGKYNLRDRVKCTNWISGVERENPVHSKCWHATHNELQSAFNRVGVLATVDVCDVVNIKGKFVFMMIHIVCRFGTSVDKAIHMEW